MSLTPCIYFHTFILMRTTIFVDDELGARFRDAARARGQSLSAFLCDAGRRALGTRSEDAAAPPFDLITRGGTGPLPGIDLDRTGELLVAEDRDQFGQ